MFICLHIVRGCFCAIVAELSSCNVDCLAWKALNIYLVFHRKSLPIPDLNSLKTYFSNWKSEVLSQITPICKMKEQL